LKKTSNIFTWIVDSVVIRKGSDIKVVVMCLLAATTFWFLNALNKDYSTRITYPVRFEYDDSVYVPLSTLPQSVRLNASGYGWNLLKKTLRLNSQSITYRISNPLRTNYITGASLMVPITEQVRDIKVNYLVEDTIFLNFDRIDTRQVVLNIDSAALNLANGYRIVSPVNITPTVINFKGPSSLLKTLPDAIFLNIPYKNIDENFSENITINYVQNPLIQSDINKAQVNFSVAPFVKETQLVSIAKLSFPGKDSIVLGDNTLEVSYWLRKDEASKVRPEDFRLVADFKTFNKEDSTVKIFLEQKPPFVSDIRVNKAIIKLHYVEEED
jgi:hypothetical protein